MENIELDTFEKRYNFNITDFIEQKKVEGESLLGEEYFIIKKEASKTKIKEAITAGKDVQGARLIENRNLQIK